MLFVHPFCKHDRVVWFVQFYRVKSVDLLSSVGVKLFLVFLTFNSCTDYLSSEKISDIEVSKHASETIDGNRNTTVSLRWKFHHPSRVQNDFK